MAQSSKLYVVTDAWADPGRLEGGVGLTQDSNLWVGTHHAKHTGTRGSGATPHRKMLNINAKVLQFRDISTHYTTPGIALQHVVIERL